METAQYHGLTAKEAQEKLVIDGYNELSSQKPKNIFYIVYEIVKEPMILLLVSCGILYLYLGDIKDSVMILTSIILLISITLYQKYRSEKVLKELQKLASPKINVIRDNETIQIQSRELVVDDIIVLREGERVPADATVLSSVNLSVDESLLTGESVPVGKVDWDGKQTATDPGGNNTSFIYTGSLIIQGRGIAKVTSIGPNTEMGKIGKSIEVIHDEDTLLSRQTTKIVQVAGFIGLLACLIVILFYGLLNSDWSGGLLAGLTLALSMIPEEFTVVLIIFLTFGAWRISKHQVLTRNNSAIETLGAATVLCVDKTGTLTENIQKLSIVVNGLTQYDIAKGKQTIDINVGEVIGLALLASDHASADPLEKELVLMGQIVSIPNRYSTNGMELVKEYPMTKDITAITRVFKNHQTGKYFVAIKGAPETILSLCGLDPKKKKTILNIVEVLSWQGIRVLAVAESKLNIIELPKTPISYKFNYKGLIGFSDPVRSDVAQSVKTAYEAGIRIIMVTGDYPGTAQFVARKIGLSNDSKITSGIELQKMNDDELQDTIRSTNIFARVLPNQKLILVNALKKQGEIVAMTGDGINDAPALKSAHIGIAMGKRGTDVAREASDLVLLDDNFTSIIKAIKLGRKIYANLRKAMAFVVSVHIPIAGMSLLPVVFNLPLLLLPAHIALLELIIDPVCSVVFESQPGDPGIMKVPPRNLHESILTKKILTISIFQGISVLTTVFVVFLYTINVNRLDNGARSIAFLCLVVANLFLVLVNLSWKETIFNFFYVKNQPLVMILALITIILFGVYSIPFLRDLFHFRSLSNIELLIALTAAFLSLLWFELIKVFNKVRI